MSMTLEQAIEHAEQVYKENFNGWSYASKRRDTKYAEKCMECAEEHRQLAEWLRELQERRKSDNEIPFGNASFDELDSIINAYEIHGNHKKVVELLKELRERRKQSEIVRCRECKFSCKYDDSDIANYAGYANEVYCSEHDIYKHVDWYCADAERRTDEHGNNG